VEGGSCNDYDYTCGDPINRFDVEGTCLGPTVHYTDADGLRKKKCWGAGVARAAGRLVVGYVGNKLKFSSIIGSAIGKVAFIAMGLGIAALGLEGAPLLLLGLAAYLAADAIGIGAAWLFHGVGVDDRYPIPSPFSGSGPPIPPSYL
jgi:hypothetical protein